MKPITPRVVDIDAYSCWLNATTEQNPSVLDGSDVARAALLHQSAKTRSLAIESFIYVWNFDDSVAEVLLALATRDENCFVRYTAGSVFKLAHIRCADSQDKLRLEQSLRQIVTCPGQTPELTDDLQAYLDILDCRMAKYET